MSVFYTKCGKKFNKSTDVATTGYECDVDKNCMLVEKCLECGFRETKRKGLRIVYECRAGSKPPNHMNSLVGNLDDKNAIRIYSLNLSLCIMIFYYAEKDPDLIPYWCKDSDDCRKVISITCSKNKKGIAAKKKLAERFFAYDGTMIMGININPESD